MRHFVDTPFDMRGKRIADRSFSGRCREGMRGVRRTFRHQVRKMQIPLRGCRRAFMDFDINSISDLTQSAGIREGLLSVKKDPNLAASKHFLSITGRR